DGGGKGSPARMAGPLRRVQPRLRPRHPVRPQDRRQYRRHPDEPAARGEVELKADRAGGGMPLWIAPLPAAALGSICGMLAIYVYNGSIAYLPEDVLYFVFSSAISFMVAFAGLVIVGLPLT